MPALRCGDIYHFTISIENNFFSGDILYISISVFSNLPPIKISKLYGNHLRTTYVDTYTDNFLKETPSVNHLLAVFLTASVNDFSQIPNYAKNSIFVLSLETSAHYVAAHGF